MMSIQEEIRADNASYLDWNEIREIEAYRKMKEKQEQKFKEEQKKRVEEAVKYLNNKINFRQARLGEQNLQITEEDIELHPIIRFNNNVHKEWNRMVKMILEEVLDTQYFLQDKPDIFLTQGECFEEPESGDGVNIVSISFDGHIYELLNENILKVAADIRYLPKTIQLSSHVKYELRG